jgi:hypothetical protein
MPIGAILYVQVPDSTTSEDWNRWREAFIASFDLCLNHSPEWYADLLAPDWRFLDRPVVANDSIWNVFPQSVFLGVNLGDTYYGPGYERGYLPKIVEQAEWFEQSIPQSRVWYVQDVFDTAMVFDTPARKILLEYYERVGSKPYQERHEKKEQWEPVQQECWRLWMLEQERVLREVKGTA